MQELRSILKVIENREREIKTLYEKFCGLSIRFKCRRCGKEWLRNGEDVFKEEEAKLCDDLDALKVRLEDLLSAPDGVVTTCGDCWAEMTARKVLPPKYCKMELLPERQRILERFWDKNLFITGPTGVGKTVLACAIAKKWLALGKSVRFISYPAFIMRLQSAFIEGESAYEEARKIAECKGLLILDDLGAESLTAFVKQVTYYVINHREQYELPIIITSNFSPHEVGMQMDKRISSRISGMCEIIRLEGRDLRREKNKRKPKKQGRN